MARAELNYYGYHSLEELRALKSVPVHREVKTIGFIRKGGTQIYQMVWDEESKNVAVGDSFINSDMSVLPPKCSYSYCPYLIVGLIDMVQHKPLLTPKFIKPLADVDAWEYHLACLEISTLFK